MSSGSMHQYFYFPQQSTKRRTKERRGLKRGRGLDRVHKRNFCN